MNWQSLKNLKDSALENIQKTLESAKSSVPIAAEDRTDQTASGTACGSNDGSSGTSEKASFLERSMENISKANAAAKSSVDDMAAKAAAQYTKWSGRKTTAEEVKKAAMVAGSVAAAACILLPALNGGAGRQMARRLSSGSRGGAMGSSPFSSLWSNPGGQNDDQAFWEQDALEYDQLQYDNLQEHTEYNQSLDDIAAEQASYNQSFDY